MNKTNDAILSYEALRERLGFFAEDEYREFTARLLACERPLVGVRIPMVREIAGQIPRELYGEFFAGEAGDSRGGAGTGDADF